MSSIETSSIEMISDSTLEATYASVTSRSGRNGALDVEKKNYTLNELSALRKMKNFITRPEGDISTRDSEYRNSVSLDMKTSLFCFMKTRGFIGMVEKVPEIIEIVPIRLAKADTASVEMIGEATFSALGEDFKVKVKMFNTNCSVQIQSMGDSRDFLAKTGRTTAEFFGNLVLNYAQEVLENNPNLDKEFLPEGLDAEINRLEEEKRTTEKQKRSELSKNKPIPPSYRRVFDKNNKKKILGYACNECEFKTKLESDLKTHIKTVHKEKQRKAIASQPENRFTTSQQNKAGACLFLCDICEYSSQTERGIKLHITRKHGRIQVEMNNENEPRAIAEKCEICNNVISPNECCHCIKCMKRIHLDCSVEDDSKQSHLCFQCNFDTDPSVSPDNEVEDNSDTRAIVTNVEANKIVNEVIQQDLVDKAYENLNNQQDIELHLDEDNDIETNHDVTLSEDSEAKLQTEITRLNQQLLDMKLNIEKENEKSKAKDLAIEKLRAEIREQSVTENHTANNARDEEVNDLKKTITETKSNASKYITRLKQTITDVNLQALKKERKVDELTKEVKVLNQEKQSHLFLLSEKNETDQQVAKLQEELHQAIKDKEVAIEHYKVLEDRLEIQNRKEKQKIETKNRNSWNHNESDDFADNAGNEESFERIYVDDSGTDSDDEDDTSETDSHDDNQEFQFQRSGRRNTYRKEQRLNQERINKRKNRNNDNVNRDPRQNNKIKTPQNISGTRNYRTNGSSYFRNDRDERPRKSPYCHFYNNRGSCSFEKDFGRKCFFRHQEAPLCFDDGNCEREKCQYFHENQFFPQQQGNETSFLGEGRKQKFTRTNTSMNVSWRRNNNKNQRN
jgi:hypothetical protein